MVVAGAVHWEKLYHDRDHDERGCASALRCCACDAAAAVSSIELDIDEIRIDEIRCHAVAWPLLQLRRVHPRAQTCIELCQSE